MKCKFFDTRFSQYAGFSTTIPSMLKYVVTNQGSVLSESDLTDLIGPVRTILKTPLSECFDRIINSGALQNFAAINVTKTDTSIPEILTMSNITIDLKHTPGGYAVNSIPKLRDKVLVDISNTLSYNRSTGTYELNVVDNFQNLFVRGQLVASYHDNDEWLSPASLIYILKSYTMTISTMIARKFSLSLPEQDKVCAILGLFFGQRMSPEGIDLTHPPIYYRLDWGLASTKADLAAVADELSDVTQNGLDLVTTCELISTRVSPRLKAFDVSAFMSLCANLGPDYLTSQLALEYPPYWVYILLQALSGNKIKLVFEMARDRQLLNEGKSKFLHNLLMDNDLYVVRR